jgi:AcrR family transcriptional regulator
MPRSSPIQSPADRRQRENAAVQAKILGAARKLFLKHGHEAVSMRKIASAIHYTPAALYVHFKDKEQLIRALMDQDFAVFAAALREANKEADPVHRLRAIGRAYVRFALTHPHHYRLMFMTPLPAACDPKKSSIERGNPNQDGYAFLRSTVQDCIAQGRFLPKYTSVDQTTLMCWACAHSVASLHIAHGTKEWVHWPDVLTACDTMLDALTEALTGTPIERILQTSVRTNASPGGNTGGVVNSIDPPHGGLTP